MRSFQNVIIVIIINLGLINQLLLLKQISENSEYWLYCEYVWADLSEIMCSEVKIGNCLIGFINMLNIYEFSLYLLGLI